MDISVNTCQGRTGTGAKHRSMGRKTKLIRPRHGRIKSTTTDTNATDIDNFLRNKYTNDQFHAWLITQVSNVYFKKLPAGLQYCQAVGDCYRYELGLTDTSYINYGYWDSLHKGLMSGEGLMSSLRQMEMDYLNMNTREYELTRMFLWRSLIGELAAIEIQWSLFYRYSGRAFRSRLPWSIFRRTNNVAVTLRNCRALYTGLSEDDIAE